MKQLIKVSKLPPFLFVSPNGSVLTDDNGAPIVHTTFEVDVEKVARDRYTDARKWVLDHIHNCHIWLNQGFTVSINDLSMELIKKETIKDVLEKDRFINSITDEEILLLKEIRKLEVDNQKFNRTPEQRMVSHLMGAVIESDPVFAEKLQRAGLIHMCCIHPDPTMPRVLNPEEQEGGSHEH